MYHSLFTVDSLKSIVRSKKTKDFSSELLLYFVSLSLISYIIKREALLTESFPFYTCDDKFKAVLFYFARDFRLFTKITVPAAARTSRTSTGTKAA